ncbi:MAG: hypothetical protein ACE366_11620 [Bradymonadia bacterium]
MAQFKVDVMTLLNALWLAVERLDQSPPPHDCLREQVALKVLDAGENRGGHALRGAAALLTWSVVDGDSPQGQLVEGVGRAVARSAAGCPDPVCIEAVTRLHDRAGDEGARWLIRGTLTEGTRWRRFIASLALCEAVMMHEDTFVLELDLGDQQPWDSTPSPEATQDWLGTLTWYQSSALDAGKVSGNSLVNFAKLVLATREAARVAHTSDRPALYNTVAQMLDDEVEPGSVKRAFDPKRICPASMGRLIEDVAEGGGGLKLLQHPLKRVITALGLEDTSHTTGAETRSGTRSGGGMQSPSNRPARGAQRAAQATLDAHCLASAIEEALEETPSGQALWPQLRAVVDDFMVGRPETVAPDDPRGFGRLVLDELARIGTLPAALARLAHQGADLSGDVLAACQSGALSAATVESLALHTSSCGACQGAVQRLNLETQSTAPISASEPGIIERVLRWLSTPQWALGTMMAVALVVWLAWPSTVREIPDYAVASITGAEGKLLGDNTPRRAFTARNRVRMVIQPDTRISGEPAHAGVYVTSKGQPLRALPRAWLQHKAAGVFIFEGPAAEICTHGPGAYTLVFAFDEDDDISTELSGQSMGDLKHPHTAQAVIEYRP